MGNKLLETNNILNLIEELDFLLRCKKLLESVNVEIFIDGEVSKQTRYKIEELLFQDGDTEIK